MANNLFNRYIWLIDTIYRAGKITFEEINNRWLKNSISEGKKMPLRTFHNHRTAIEEMFDINIECDKSTYEYYIDNAEDMERGGVRMWLLSTFAVNNLVNESQKLRNRIQFEHVPSGQKFLASIIEAMRDGVTLAINYQSYWSDKQSNFEVEPYFVKIFKQRWYVIGKSDKVRIYALDRISSLETTPNKFTLPTTFDPETYFSDCYGIILDNEIKALTVKLKFTAEQVNYVKDLPLHHSQKEIETTNEYTIFEYFICPTFDFRQEILLHGDNVEVVSPLSFRNEIKQIVENLHKMYF